MLNRNHFIAAEVCAILVLGSNLLGAFHSPEEQENPPHNLEECETPLPYNYAAHCEFPPPPNFNFLIEEAASEYGVDPRILATTVYIESGCDASALGKSGDTGLTQIMPRIWGDSLREEGLEDLWSPEENLRAGAFVLSEMSLRSSTTREAIRRYNGTGKRAQRYLEKHARLYESIWNEEYSDSSV